jgi:hypothetical protein
MLPRSRSIVGFWHEVALCMSVIMSAKGSKRKFAAASTNVGIWHNVRAQPGAFERTQTGGLPTVEPERWFIAAFQTRIQAAASAYT